MNVTHCDIKTDSFIVKFWSPKTGPPVLFKCFNKNIRPKRRGIVRQNNRFPRETLSETEKLAIQAVRGVAAIRRLINVEEKYFDQSNTTSPTSLAPTIALLTGVGQGDDAITRDGRSILGQRLHVKGYVVIDPTIVTGTVVRLIVFSDKVSNNAMPSNLDVLQPLVGSGGYVNTPYNHDDLNNRFVFHKDLTIALGNINSANPIVPFDFSLSYNSHVKFDGSSAGITSAETGHLFFMACSNATSAPSVVYTSRFTFTDN